MTGTNNASYHSGYQASNVNLTPLMFHVRLSTKPAIGSLSTGMHKVIINSSLVQLTNVSLIRLLSFLVIGCLPAALPVSSGSRLHYRCCNVQAWSAPPQCGTASYAGYSCSYLVAAQPPWSLSACSL